ncbi:MAG: MFS transporter [Candidatus Eisenbacteria bacterium]
MRASERKILILLSAVQFVNVLDAMMVMPLGPDFAKALGISMSHLGWIGGSYTLAGAVMGFLGSFFLDRFDRRSALAVAMGGLVVATAAGGFAINLPTLIAARMMAGLCGGPAASLTLSIIADVIPIERRGRAIGSVMAAFSVASVLGVPAGLELARHGGWRIPFFAVAALGLTVAVGAALALPSLRGHLGRARTSSADGFRSLFNRRLVNYSLGAMAVGMMSGFIMIPNIAAYLQYNAGFPREKLGSLYLMGGIASFAAMRGAGVLTDRWSGTGVSLLGTSLFLAVLVVGFLTGAPLLPVTVCFVAFMVSMTMRGVPLSALSTRVPREDERARFLSLQSSIQHLAAAIGSFLSSRILSEGEGHRLIGIPTLTGVAMTLAACLPLLLWRVEKGVRAIWLAPLDESGIQGNPSSDSPREARGEGKTDWSVRARNG